MERMTNRFIGFLKEQGHDVFGKFVGNLFARQSAEELGDTGNVAETANILRLQGVEDWNKDPYYKHYHDNPDPIEYISRAFSWEATPEGFTYWEEINDKWLDFFGKIEYTNLGKSEDFDDKTRLTLNLIRERGYKAEVRIPSELYGDGYADVWYHQLALTYSEPI